jgi:hypothetical protein
LRIEQPLGNQVGLQTFAEEYMETMLNTDLSRHEIRLPSLFDEYQDDFGSSRESILRDILSFCSCELRDDLIAMISKSEFVHVRVENYRAETFHLEPQPI